MVKASFTLPHGTSIVVEGKVSLDLPVGTVVTLEGTPKDVQKLLDNVNGASKQVPSFSHKSKTNGDVKSSGRQGMAPSSSETVPDILKIVNTARSCPEAEAIEKNILENQPRETDRVLLPLYIVHEYLDNAYGLTTVEIAAIAKELGPRAKITRQNALRTLTKRDASKYVSADKMRKPGTGTRYTLNDRGVQYMKSVLEKTLALA